MGIDSSLVDQELSNFKKAPDKTAQVVENNYSARVPRLEKLEGLNDAAIVTKKARAGSYQEKMKEIERRKSNQAENMRATLMYLSGDSREVKSARALEDCRYFKQVDKPEVAKDFYFSDGSALNWKWSQDYGKTSTIMETIKEEEEHEDLAQQQAGGANKDLTAYQAGLVHEDSITQQAGPALFVPAQQTKLTLHIPAYEDRLPSLDQLVTHRE